MSSQFAQYPDVLFAIIFVTGAVVGTFVGEMKAEILRRKK